MWSAFVALTCAFQHCAHCCKELVIWVTVVILSASTSLAIFLWPCSLTALTWHVWVCLFVYCIILWQLYRLLYVKISGDQQCHSQSHCDLRDRSVLGSGDESSPPPKNTQPYPVEKNTDKEGSVVEKGRNARNCLRHCYGCQVARRDRIVVSTLRCGRSNPGSNPGHGNVVDLFSTPQFIYFFIESCIHHRFWCNIVCKRNHNTLWVL